ncbi:TIGR03620 family F420-dependent LLM class oxidoreductase [Frankia sp. AgB32]|uniref:TIGR03620 family F420-dependent LLM class oxidoreductase n=1 Tax=Frankia sp. AgB32 TaxID=631119 RepID=UPI0020101D62|nr:TIGR03620 family F420-dependent LLM class oxidoreductase [Frankia sp. AgB32]MCK9896511.1 TIGR03620 family F420-dependent LLM class oxidoreductase [Frankia sp. AgB32]
MEISGVGVWSQELRYGDPGEAAEAAAELEQLGFGALWIPDMGGDTFEAAGKVLAATRRVVVATGVLNLWNYEPAQAAAAYAQVVATHGDRLLLGIGVSHAIAVDRADAGRYRRPLSAMAAFLDGVDAAPAPIPTDRRVLAALGPRMLELAAKRARGVHPYLVTPAHTRIAREAVGDGPLVVPEQTVVLCADRDEAHAVAGGWLRGYLSLPNYANSLIRLGFEPDEVASASDRVFDAMIAWGDEEAVRRRVAEHHAAGADQVTLQVLTADQNAFPRAQWRRLAAALA